ncbi:hypothetical protein DEIPH_ctg025orf0049 [Deinococcus phoenicis]|uniref:Uncharacterized protein n=1 Tax=Deinococcus phoenicis TaxID=1476583 RepID=A0A016QQQ3_9DEIO|nr:hypothetical protein [Deinococcus phoenicis]EYB68212.1 hypothetical protein DEIPH_ctg025orf0049 [Deinococcus phoenicis]
MEKDSAKSSGPALNAVWLSVAATFLAAFAANNQSWLRFVALAVALLLIVAAGALLGQSTAQARQRKQNRQ